MIDFDYVLKRLESSKGKLPQVAEGSGVRYRTLQKIAAGTTKSPRIEHIKALNDYFRDQEPQEPEAA